MVDKYHDTFVKTHRIYNTKSEPNVSCGLWVIMMHQYRFTEGNKGTTVLGVLIVKGVCEHVRQEMSGSLSIFSFPSA